MYKAKKSKMGNKISVTMLGRQPDSHLWALGKSTLIDETTGG